MTICESKITLLDELVKKALGEGWQPYGNVYIQHVALGNNEKLLFMFQAVVKYEPSLLEEIAQLSTINQTGDKNDE